MSGAEDIINDGDSDDNNQVRDSISHAKLQLFVKLNGQYLLLVNFQNTCVKF